MSYARALLTIAVAFVAVLSALGKDLQEKISINLDGKDANGQLIVTHKPLNADTTGFTVTYRGYSFKGDYLSAANPPTFKAVTPDTTNSRQLLLVETIAPSGSFFELYGFRANVGFLPIYTRFSGDCDLQPYFDNGGYLVVGEWQGFWMKKQHYFYDGKQDTYNASGEHLFSVEVKATAISDFAGLLSGGNARGVFAVQKGESLDIVLYDDQWNNYLVRNKQGTLGWVPRETLEESLEGLPSAC